MILIFILLGAALIIDPIFISFSYTYLCKKLWMLHPGKNFIIYLVLFDSLIILYLIYSGGEMYIDPYNSS